MADEQDYEIQEQQDGSAVVDLPEITTEEQPDGSAIIEMENGPEFNPDFYDILADSIDPGVLSSLTFRYMDLLESDKEARSKRDEQYEEGIRRTGMGKDAPGGATFMGASKVVHPAMAEGCVDFAARAIKELFPPDGPVKTKIIGRMDEIKSATAERKKDFLNWQLTEQIEEFRDEQEQLLTQLPLGGSQYFKLWFDEQKKRPCVEFLPIDRVILPFAATNFYTAQRAAEVHEITQYEFDRRVRTGMYRDIQIVKATQSIEQSKVQKANDKVEGKQFEENKDGLRKLYHIYTWLELEDDKKTKGKSAPYILMIDELDSTVVGLYRNWEEGDELMTKLDWIVEFKFIPWRGAYAIGLPHLIGGLSAARLSTPHKPQPVRPASVRRCCLRPAKRSAEISSATSTPSACACTSMPRTSAACATMPSLKAKPSAKSSRSAGVASMTACEMPLNTKATGTSSMSNSTPSLIRPPS